MCSGALLGHPAKRLDELLPWTWQAARQAQVTCSFLWLISCVPTLEIAYAW